MNQASSEYVAVVSVRSEGVEYSHCKFFSEITIRSDVQKTYIYLKIILKNVLNTRNNFFTIGLKYLHLPIQNLK